MSKKSEAERLKLAKELCQKDGKEWDGLDDYGKHSYGHYADVVIRNRQAPTKEVEAPVVPSDQCPACDGKGFNELDHGLTMERCENCNGTGKIEPSDKGGINDITSGAGRDNQSAGSGDTSKPKQSGKPKDGKKAPKKSS